MKEISEHGQDLDAALDAASWHNSGDDGHTYTAAKRSGTWYVVKDLHE